MDTLGLADGWILLNPEQINNITSVVRSSAFLQTIFAVYNTEITDSIARLSLKVMDLDIDMPEYIESAVQQLLNQLTSESANALAQLFMYGLYVIVPRKSKSDSDELTSTPEYIDTMRLARKALEKFSVNNPPPLKKRKMNPNKTLTEGLFNELKQKFSQKDIVVLPLEKVYVYKRFNTDPSVYQYEFKVFMQPFNALNPTPVEIKEAMVFCDYEFIDTKSGDICSLVVNIMPDLIMCSTLQTTYAIGVTRHVNQATAEESPPLMGMEQIRGFVEHEDDEVIAGVNTRRIIETRNNLDNIKHTLEAFNSMKTTYNNDEGKNVDWDNMSKINPLASMNPFIETLRRGYPLQAPPYPVKPGSKLVPLSSPTPDGSLSEHIEKYMRVIAGRFNLSMSWLQGTHSTGSMNASSSQVTESQLESKRSFTKRYSQIIEKHLKTLTEKLFDIEMFQIFQMVENFLIDRLGQSGNRQDVSRIIQKQTDLVVTLITRSSPFLTADILIKMHQERIISREDRDSQILQIYNLNPRFLMDPSRIIEEIKEDIKIETVNAELTGLKTNSGEDSKEEKKPGVKKQKKENDTS